jgi:hypothetical protein
VCLSFHAQWSPDIAHHKPSPGKELLDALEVLHEVGIDAGRELLGQGATDWQSESLPLQPFVYRIEWGKSENSNSLA